MLGDKQQPSVTPHRQTNGMLLYRLFIMQVSGNINVGIVAIDSDGWRIKKNIPMSELVRDLVCSLILIEIGLILIYYFKC